MHQELVDAAQRAVKAGLLRLSAGNLSCRVGAGKIAVTPSGVEYSELSAADIRDVGLADGAVPESRNTPRPSSELPMHLEIYRAFPDVGAVVHTHSPFAMSFAVAGVPIAAVCLEVLACGGEIPVAPWGCPGTRIAGEQAVAEMKARPGLKAVLLRNHGLVAVGADLAKAFQVALDAETAAQVYHAARQLGPVRSLTEAQIAEVRERYPAL